MTACSALHCRLGELPALCSAPLSCPMEGPPPQMGGKFPPSIKSSPFLERRSHFAGKMRSCAACRWLPKPPHPFPGPQNPPQSPPAPSLTPKIPPSPQISPQLSPGWRWSSCSSTPHPSPTHSGKRPPNFYGGLPHPKTPPHPLLAHRGPPKFSVSFAVTPQPRRQLSSQVVR